MLLRVQFRTAARATDRRGPSASVHGRFSGSDQPLAQKPRAHHAWTIPVGGNGRSNSAEGIRRATVGGTEEGWRLERGRSHMRQQGSGQGSKRNDKASPQRKGRPPHFSFRQEAASLAAFPESFELSSEDE